MSFLDSPRTASIVVALVVLALIPIAIVAVLNLDGGADEPTAAVSSSDDEPEGADELAALERRVMVLENRDERRSDELTALRAELEATAATLTELDGADLPGAIAATTEQLTALDGELRALDGGLTALAGDVAGQSSTLDATASELRGAIDELRGGIATLRNDLDRTGGNVEVLRGEVATLRDRLDRLQRGG